MGFVLDEEWESEEEEKEYSKEEKAAMKTFDYDYDEWDSLSYAERKQKIFMSNRMSRGT